MIYFSGFCTLRIGNKYDFLGQLSQKIENSMSRFCTLLALGSTNAPVGLRMYALSRPIHLSFGSHFFVGFYTMRVPVLIRSFLEVLESSLLGQVEWFHIRRSSDYFRNLGYEGTEHLGTVLSRSSCIILFGVSDSIRVLFTRGKKTAFYVDTILV